MILDAIIAVLVSFVTAVLALMPSYELPASLSEFGGSLGGWLGNVGSVFPVGTLGVCLGLVLGARLFLVAWALVVWVYTKIPGKFT